MVGIRTDMNNVIATGHIMRCLAIADAIRQLGEDTIFFLADAEGKDLVEKRGNKACVLHTYWKDLEQELDKLAQLVAEYEITCLLIDSYQVTEGYLKKLSSLTRTIYIDDLGMYSYPVDAIICYANYWRKLYYKKGNQGTRLFLGTEYVPLRGEFCNCEKKQITEKAETLLLLSGGTAPFQIFPSLLEGIDYEAYRKVDVICGTYYTEYDELCKRYEAIDNIYFHRAVSNIEKYMMEADLAVSAGGTTLYELCAMGVPTISYSFADNQIENVRQFHEDRVIDYAGDVRKDVVVATVNQYLDVYRQDRELRSERSRKMQMMVDGKGAMRIARQLLDLERAVDI